MAINMVMFFLNSWSPVSNKPVDRSTSKGSVDSCGTEKKVSKGNGHGEI